VTLTEQTSNKPAVTVCLGLALAYLAVLFHATLVLAALVVEGWLS